MKKHTGFSRIAFLVMIMFILIGTTGCAFKQSPYKKIEKYLKAKYDNDRFTEVNPYYGKLFNNGPVYSLTCKSKLHPEFPIYGAYVETTDTFYDNYMSVVYAEQFDEYVEENILDELFGRGNYDYLKFNDDDRMNRSEHYYKDMTFQEFVTVAPVGSLEVMVDASCLADKDAFLESLTDRMEKSGIDYNWVRIYFLDPFEKAELDSEKIDLIMVSREDVVCYLEGEKTGDEFTYTWE